MEKASPTEDPEYLTRTGEGAEKNIQKREIKEAMKITGNKILQEGRLLKRLNK